MTSSEAALEASILVSSFSYDESFARSPLLVDATLSSDQYQIRLEALVDTGATGYAFIDETKAQEVCEQLGIEPTPLSKPRPVKGFDGKNSPRPITHMINPTLTVQGHSESLCPMLITPWAITPSLLVSPG